MLTDLFMWVLRDPETWQNVCYLFVIAWGILLVLFVAEGAYYAVRWLRDRYLWIKWWNRVG